ncbi:uncharacterized protein [Physcomitrium patens]|uniref:Uncharacterized protein n=1 Tax=Physcomitrium patens TaxID=3218 RepID=A0A2K1IUF0_PHYPA|nr:uncharacterized protein LOC112273267 isoform X2 [Physcomitrium patens]PNR32888.1 hypothetical protein PHYPA_024831 [Physcomitrium patens]|eukprot:XP_024357569.1 uncharacterized protein LOC112273267 isoform X2 [Physcomitrella patens]
MKNRRSSWRYSAEETKGNGREWRVRNSIHREESSTQHLHNAPREEGRGATRWDSTALIDYGPPSTDGPVRRSDVRETETKADDGWGSTPVDNDAATDLTSAWEALATSSLSDWSKPPQIESIEHWDDTGAKETWDFVIIGRTRVNNPDLYVEKNIDWNAKIPPDLLAYVDDKNRCRKASRPRAGSPVLLGLEVLGQSFGDHQPQGQGDKEKAVLNQSKEKHEQVGGRWGDVNQNSKLAQRRTDQQLNQRVSGEMQSTLIRDNYEDRGRKRRGDKDEYHRKPRFRTTHRLN